MTDVNTWNATDDSNNSAAPAGWPEGMMPSGVNNAARAMMGSLKRWRDQTQLTMLATGTGNAQVITYPVAPAALAGGDCFTFLSVANNTGPATLQVNAQAAKPINNNVGGPLVGGEMPAGAIITVYYDSANFRLASDPGALRRSGDNMPGDLTVNGSLTANADIHLRSNLWLMVNNGALLVTDPIGSFHTALQLDPSNVLHIGFNTTGLTQVSAGSDVLVNPGPAGNFAVTRGSALKPGGGLWTALSDARTKEGVTNFTKGLAALKRLQPVAYRQNGRGGTERDGRTYVGLIADEAEAIMPELVGSVRQSLDPGGAPEDIKTLDATALVYALLNAVKELAARVAALER